MVEFKLRVGSGSTKSGSKWFRASVLGAYLPDGSFVKLEPKEKDWYRSSTKLYADATFEAPVGSVVKYYEASEKGVEVSYLLVTENGLEPLQEERVKEELGEAGGHKIYSFKNIIRLPSGKTIEEEWDSVFVEGVPSDAFSGFKRSELEALKKRLEEAAPLTLDRAVFTTFVFKPTRRLSDEEFRELSSVFRYDTEFGEGGKQSAVFAVDIAELTAEGRERALTLVKKYAGEGAAAELERALKEWSDLIRKKDEERSLVEQKKEILSKALGARVVAYTYETGYLGRGQEVEEPRFRVRLEKLGEDKFKEFAEKYEYSLGEFVVRFDQIPDAVKEMVEKGLIDRKLLEKAERAAEWRRKEKERKERIKEILSEALGVKVESFRLIEDSRSPYFKVRTERLGDEKFREFAKKYEYSYGEFTVEAHKILEAVRQMAEEGLIPREVAEAAHGRFEELAEKKRAEEELKKALEQRLGVKVERVVDAGDHYEVKTERLGHDVFKKFAKKYGYSNGYFRIPKGEAKDEGLGLAR